MRVYGLLTWFGGSIVALLGGRDRLLEGLLLFMALDVASGVLVALYQERISVRETYRMGIRKVGVLIAVGVASALDSLVGGPDDAQLVRGATIGFFIGLVEGLSVLRNLRLLGLPLPEQLDRALFRTVPADERRAGAEPAPPLVK